MSKLIHILANVGRVITVYFLLFMLSLFCVVASPSSKTTKHLRCDLELTDYDLSFLNNIGNYEIYKSCNTIDIVISTNLKSKEEVVSLSIYLSFFLVPHENMQVIITDINGLVYYIKIKENGTVILV